ncbi:MAG TPA: hypothetical protein VGQ91_16565 [Ideonella sp.]|nr:hypothetical protein [Ideonella sp.]
MRFAVLRMIWACCALVLAWPAATHAADGPVFELGTSQGEDTLPGKMQRRIYGEAFRRLGLPLHFNVMPLQRLSAAADQGQIDGDVARVPGYGADHPELVRVDETVYDVTFALFTTNPTLTLPSLAALADTNWRGTYIRGAAVCLHALRPLLPGDRLIDVSTDAQGFDMLCLGRSEVHCTADLSALTLRYSPGFRGIDIMRKVADIGSYALHPYLHRRHAELAPKLAAVLKQMKAEGLVERYRAESLRELEGR